MLLIGRAFSEEDLARADLLGAIGCLCKPVSFQSMAEAIAAAQGRPFIAVSPRVYALPPARAHLLDPNGQESQIVWGVHDLSLTGALIDTRGPIPVGTQLALALCIGGQRLTLESEVVRIQEPAWDTLAGVAVRFRDVTSEQRIVLEREIRRRGPRSR